MVNEKKRKRSQFKQIEKDLKETVFNQEKFTERNLTYNQFTVLSAFNEEVKKIGQKFSKFGEFSN